MRTDLVVALDYSKKELAEALMHTLKDYPLIYKVGLELFLSAGPDWVKELTSKGVRVFLDLKFHDIPNTVGHAVLQASQLGAEFTTIHLAGGKQMMDEIETKFREAELSGKPVKRAKVLGVTVLTSFKEADWIANVSHMAKLTSIRSIEETVMRFATLANDHPALHGLVCSPNEIAAIRSKFPKLFLMVPGIRPEGTSAHDQNRVMTPRDASSLGASAIVVGRPITQAADPLKIVETILKELK